MSSNDKTRQKLMESMRKTKAGTGKKSKEDDSKANSKAKDDKPERKKTKTAGKKKSSKPSLTTGADPYQSGRRIWPD